MPSPSFTTTIDHLATRLAAGHLALAEEWLDRLNQILDVDKRDVFPSHQLLDHIPALIVEIAAYLKAPVEQQIAANTRVMDKASELGLLRFDQRASVHQLLREYQLFSEVLEAFFARETMALGDEADAPAAVLALGRTQQAIRVLEQRTVDAFITRYTETIEVQTSRLRMFSRLVSHEIRQPLDVLQVLARTLSRQAEGDNLRLIDTVQRNVVRLAEVAGMLERLALLTGRTEQAPNEQDVDLTAVAQDVAGQLRDMAAARGVTIHVDGDLPTIAADAGRVELVIVNLLANAVKYSDPARESRVVRLSRDAGSPNPRVHIRDNGIGIPKAKLDKIFDQFVRVHRHLDHDLGVNGMGLGLSIVRECMEAMNGSVIVESIEGEGTTFTLEWPAGSAPARDRATPPQDR